MALYALITAEEVTDADVLGRLETLYQNNRKIAPNAWIILAHKQTTKDIGEALFPTTKTETGSLIGVRYVLFRVETWWGFHDRTLWEWLDESKKADAQ